MKKRLAAEFLGTFGIVFAPCAASAAGHLAGGDSSILAAALASGLSVTAMIHALGHVSGDFNPAVTLGFASVGRRTWREVGPFVLAQIAGALCAAALVRGLFGTGAWGTHTFAGSPLQALGMEATLTFFLMLVILGSATDERATKGFAGLAIGLWVVAAIFLGGPVTGGSMNPARSLGPALISGGAALGSWWVYALGPVLGAVLAARLYEMLRAQTP